MIRERIEDMREVVLPFVKKRLLETNYENLGESDAEEFARDFNEILDLAIKALEQEPKTGKWISTETKGVRYAFWCRYKCSLCGGLSDHTNFCPNCGAKMEREE